MARPRPLLHSRSPRVAGAGPLPTHDANGRPLLRLQTLGATSILIGDLRLGTSAGTLFSLLLRMVGTPGMQVSAESLRASLWPDQVDVRQRANLRQTLYKLRGYGVRISHATGMVVLDETQLLRTFSVERSAELFARDVTHGVEPFGPYVPGFTVPWPALQEWIEEHRELVHAEVRRVLSDQLRQRRDRADWSGAGALARWLLQFDPLNEEATLTIAECTAMSGSKKEALAVLDRYLDELGPMAGDIRLPATMLRRRIAEPLSRGRLSFAPTERHFVGRATELAELTLAMRRARWHDGSAVLLHGPPGIGKSRLAHELEKVARIEGVRVTQASCRESDVLRPLSVFLDLVPELMHQPGALGCAPESLAALRRLLPADRHVASSRPPESSREVAKAAAKEVATDVAKETAESLSEVAAAGPVERAGDLPVIAREPMPMAASLRRAIIDLLAAVADERPMLLIVEDVHWIDEHSWDVLSDLIDRLQSLRVFVVLTSREPHARPQRPQRVPIGLRVQPVPPLSPESSLELSRAIGDDLSAPVSDELGAWFVRASEGIPLFLRALVNHWIETGEAGGVPPTLQGVIEQRLSQLSGDALRVLQTAALLGKWATVERVGRVLELRTNEMLQCLEQMTKLGVLASAPTGVVATHEMIAQTARAAMSALLRQSLHRRSGETLGMEAKEQHDVELLVASLDHWERGGDRAKLVSETIANVEALSCIGIPAIGLAALSRIEAHELGTIERPAIASGMARLMLGAGEYSRAISSALKGLHLPSLDRRPSDSELDLALSLVDSTYRADPLVDRNELMEFTCSVAELPYASSATRMRAADIGLIIASNECDDGVALRLFRAISDGKQDQNESDAFRRAAILYHTIFGDAEAARNLAEWLFARSLAAPVSTAAYQDALRAGFALRLISSSRTHLSALRQAFDIANKLDAPTHCLNAAWLLAQSYLELGERVDFQHWLSQVSSLFSVVREPVVCNYAVGLFCRASIEDGDQMAALRHYETFVRNLPKMPTLKASTYSLSLQIGVQLLNPTWSPTEDQMAALIARHRRVARFGTCDFVTSMAAEALFRVGRKVEAEALVREYLCVRREVGSVGERLSSTAEAMGIQTGATNFSR